MNQKSKIFFSIIGIIVGFVIIIVGLTVTSFHDTYAFNGTVQKISYGGDAYTGIQQAAAQGANNTYHFFEMFRAFVPVFVESVKVLIVSIGVLVIIHYSVVISNCFHQKKVDEDRSHIIDLLNILIEENGKKEKNNSKQTKKE